VQIIAQMLTTTLLCAKIKVNTGADSEKKCSQVLAILGIPTFSDIVVNYVLELSLFPPDCQIRRTRSGFDNPDRAKEGRFGSFLTQAHNLRLSPFSFQ
jgi:hypothetical protein